MEKSLQNNVNKKKNLAVKFGFISLNFKNEQNMELDCCIEPESVCVGTLNVS